MVLAKCSTLAVEYLWLQLSLQDKKKLKGLLDSDSASGTDFILGICLLYWFDKKTQGLAPDSVWMVALSIEYDKVFLPYSFCEQSLNVSKLK